MRREHIGHRFRETYKIVGGQRFFGQILDIPDTTRVSNFHSARRLLRVGMTSPIAAGMVIVTPQEDRFLLGVHGVSFGYRHFKMFAIDRRVRWTREFQSKDLVTGLTKSGPPEDFGLIDCTFEDKNSLEDQLGIPADRDVILTGSDLKLGDLVDNRVVYRVMTQIGLTIAEVR